MTRKALGRGLGALLSVESRPTDDTNLIQLDQIHPNPVQPRTNFDEAKLAELSQSIIENGLVQPLVVRRRGSNYELIAGERRWRAAKIAGLSSVPAIVRDVPDEKLLELALIENIQREELNPIEEAGAYKKLIETVGLTQEVLAKRVGRDRSYITNYLRLLRLPEDLQQLVQEGMLSTGHARTLLAVSGEDHQRRLAKRIINEQLSVRQVEKLVKQKETTQVTKSAVTPDPNVRAAEARLRRVFGTRVRIVQHPNLRSGRIELEFFNDQDLNRLYDLLTKSAQAATAQGL
ncbi:MAG TPA: ParB/RepB/Spo0J family partition protein [Pyrinomonadaceae bacterium]|jgi:ParB family chromosome partitioning protein